MPCQSIAMLDLYSHTTLRQISTAVLIVRAASHQIKQQCYLQPLKCAPIDLSACQ